MSKISENAVDHPRLVFLGSFLLIALGALALVTLPKERTPRIKIPVVIVAVPNPGAQPLTNDVQIVRRIEDAAAGELDKLDDDGGIQSSSVYGAGIVRFFFKDGADNRAARQDVQDVIDRVKAEFPQRAQLDPGPTVDDVDFDSFSLVQVFIGGGDIERRLAVAEELKKRVEFISGVSDVVEFGKLDEEVEVLVDPERLAQLGLSVFDLERAVGGGNVDLPTGEIESAGGAERRVRFEGRYETLDDLRRVPVAQREGGLIRLGDVAEVRMGFEPAASLARYAGEPAIVLQVRGQKDIDVRGTTLAVEREVDAYIRQTGLDPDAKRGSGEVVIGYNHSQAREIQVMFDQLGSSALLGMVLVVVFLTFFMGVRNALLISIAIPFSLIVAAAFMLLAKRTFAPDLAINNMTLFSLILVIGMVVDGALIVGENIHRNLEMGRSAKDAAKMGIREVGPAVIAADLTTIAAFAPMYLVRGVMGDFMGTMPTVVILALTASVLVDHFLIPVLSVYLLRARKKSGAEEKHEVAEGRIDVPALERLVARSRSMRVFGSVARYAIRHRLLVLSLSALAISTPVVMMRAGALGFEFFPKADNAMLEVGFELPLGSDMETRTVDVAWRVEEAIERAVLEEEWHRPAPGSPRARPTTTIGDVGALSTRMEEGAESGPEFGRVYCEFVLEHKRDRSVNEIARAIEAALPELPGVRFSVDVPSEGPPAGSDIALRVLARGDVSLDRLAARASQIERLVHESPGAKSIKSSHRLRPQIRAVPIREVAGFADVTTVDIARSLGFALRGVEVTDVDFGGDEKIDIRIRADEEKRRTITDLKDLPVRTASGRVVSLDQVADIERVADANSIDRYDRDRVVTVTADLREGFLADDVKAYVLDKLGASPVKEELSFKERMDRFFSPRAQVLYRDAEIVVQFAGSNELRDEATADLGLAMVIAMLLMLSILITQFNSFIQPIIIIGAVPISLVGVSIGLAGIQLNFSVAAMIGVVALAGVVVNDGIVIVEFINQLRDAGVEKGRAIVLAGQLRLRPVFLTTVTTIGGLLPLALNISGGGDFWKPLTVSIIFGYASATVLTLLILPLAYYTFVRAPTSAPTSPAAAAPVAPSPLPG